MIDSVRIYVKAGDGGNGCNSFKGKKFTRSYHSDGGNGGRGADVIIRVDRNKQSLEYVRVKQHFRAENGKCGSGNKKKGADGRPCVIKVPPGTIIRDAKTNLLLRDLAEPDGELVVARAGEGGKGNAKVKPATSGLPGEERHLSLELKLVADIGLIGYPNTGKSTFLARISSARPKTASYPFTTSSPFLGALELSDFDEVPALIIVEIPGLIKGSTRGKGLGAQFLRHAERTRVLIHLIDMAAEEGRDPFEDYRNLNQELKSYNQRLFNKPQILVANKMDLPKAEINLRNFSSRADKKIWPISAKECAGIKELLDCIKNYFRKDLSNEKKLTG